MAMDDYHRLLQRQLTRYFVGSETGVPPEWQPLLEAINQTYQQFDLDRDIVNRSLELSSKELLSANSQMNAILNAFPDLIFHLDSDGTIVDYRTSSSYHLHFPPERLCGMRVQDASPQNIAVLFDDAIRQVLETRDMARIEYTVEEREQPIHYEARLTYLMPFQIIAVIRDITERKNVERELLQTALHDTLTGLPNRALFMARLKTAVCCCNARGKPRALAVLFLDLDRFKLINDSLGHKVGDLLLIAVASRLRGCLQVCDIAARLGGDEFTVLLENIDDVHSATKVASRILKTLSTAFDLEGQRVFVGASIGIVISDSCTYSPDNLLRDADTAMYRAKSQGKGRYEVFDTEMHRQVVRQVHLEADLHQAVENQELFVLYQPIVSVSTGKIQSLEAVLRWQHPKQGVIEPSDFITVAEDTGLIVPIGEWVLRTACAQAMQWAKAGYDALKIAVNVSVRQLYEPRLLELLKTLASEGGPTIILEITESVAMRDVKPCIEVLQSISDLGVQILIDDFGTAYSSLSQLKLFPFNGLKIDRSFIEHVDKSEDYQAIVSAIIEMAHRLKLTVVAEGVEREPQLDFLKASGCEEMQGFYYSKPVTAEAIGQLLADEKM